MSSPRVSPAPHSPAQRGVLRFEASVLGGFGPLGRPGQVGEPAPGYDEVLIAGEPEWRMARERSGIPIPVALWEHLASLAGTLKVAPPEPMPTPR